MSRFPSTFAALQLLVMAMAEASNAGKLDDTVSEALSDTVGGMLSDGIVQIDSQPSQVRSRVVEAISEFAIAFPNWQDAYDYGQEILVESPELADERIASIMRSLRA